MLNQWLRDPDEGFVQARRTDQTKKQNNKTYIGFEILEPASKAKQQVWRTQEEIAKEAHDVEDDHLMGLADCCQLRNVVDAAVLQTMHTRYMKGQIYTMIDQIIVSCNPFERLGLDTPEVMDKYLNAADSREQPPHVFSIAQTALSGCVREGLNQAILISGESGAGKTEACKIMLGYFADAAGGSTESSSAGDNSHSRIQDRIMQCNPILEAFGNAKTSRNNNSSRFGKWTAIHFNQKGHISGAGLIDYLLEKSRVLSQSKLERNFHIFFFIMNGPDAGKYGITSKKHTDYEYLRDGAPHADGLDDAAEYGEVAQAFDDVNLDKAAQTNLCKAVIGILLLGNVKLAAAANDSSKVESGDNLVAKQWECDPKVLGVAITTKKLVVGKDVTMKQLKPPAAVEARNGLATLIYARLFQFVMEHLNNVIMGDDAKSGGQKGKKQGKELGLLDIAGFESFPTNTWEQITINLSNENLQQHFNEFVFKREIEDYKREGVPIEDINFEDNQEILDTIGAPRDSIFSILDDASRGMRQTDKTFMSALNKKMEEKKNMYFIPDKFNKDPPEFTLIHYAGKVTYNVGNWVHEKNVDEPPPEAMDILASSKNALLQHIGKQLKEEGKKKKSTVSTNFRASLKQLLDRIRNAEPHFVRCIKPNDEKKPKIFTRVKVLEQLVFSGAMGAVKIRQSGYPLRAKPDEFCRKYRACFPVKLRQECEKKAGKKLPDAAVIKLILEKLPSVFGDSELQGQFVMGKTKVMARLKGHQALDEKVRLAVQDKVLVIQKYWRGYQARKMTKRARELRRLTQEFMKKFGKTLYSGPGKNGLALFGKDFAAQVEKVRQWAVEIDKLGSRMRVCEPSFTTARTKLGKEYDVYKDIKKLQQSVDMTELQTAVSHLQALQIEDEASKGLQARLAALSDQLPLMAQLTALDALEGKAPNPKDLETCKKLMTVVEAGIAKKLTTASAWLDPDAGAKFMHLMKLWAEVKPSMPASLLSMGAGASLDKADADMAKRQLEQGVATNDQKGIETAIAACVAAGVAADALAPAREMLTHLVDPGWIEKELTKLLTEVESGSSKDPLIASKIANLAAAGEAAGVDAGLLARAEEQSRSAHQKNRGSIFQRDGNLLASDTSTMNALYGDMSKAPCMNTAVVKPIIADDGKKIMPCDPGGSLAWSKRKLSSPLTNIADASLHSTATSAFRNVLGWMTDHPVDEKRRAPLAYAIVWKARSEPGLTNEMYVQVIKQLTHNPGVRSQLLGWKLLAFVFQYAAPSPDFVEYVRCFLQRSKTTFEADLPAKKEFLVLVEQCRESLQKLCPAGQGPVGGGATAGGNASAKGAGAKKGSEDKIDVWDAESLIWGTNTPWKDQKGNDMKPRSMKAGKELLVSDLLKKTLTTIGVNADSHQRFELYLPTNCHDPVEQSKHARHALESAKAASFILRRRWVGPKEKVNASDVRYASLTVLQACQMHLDYIVPDDPSIFAKCGAAIALVSQSGKTRQIDESTIHTLVPSLFVKEKGAKHWVKLVKDAYDREYKQLVEDNTPRMDCLGRTLKQLQVLRGFASVQAHAKQLPKEQPRNLAAAQGSEPLMDLGAPGLIVSIGLSGLTLFASKDGRELARFGMTPVNSHRVTGWSGDNRTFSVALQIPKGPVHVVFETSEGELLSRMLQSVSREDRGGLSPQGPVRLAGATGRSPSASQAGPPSQVMDGRRATGGPTYASAPIVVASDQNKSPPSTASVAGAGATACPGEAEPRSQKEERRSGKEARDKRKRDREDKEQKDKKHKKDDEENKKEPKSTKSEGDKKEPKSKSDKKDKDKKEKDGEKKKKKKKDDGEKKKKKKNEESSSDSD